MAEFYNHPIEIDTPYGCLSDVPAEFNCDTEFFRRDPAVGQFSDRTEITSCEFVSANIEGLLLGRVQLVALLSGAQVEAIEEEAADSIQSQIDDDTAEAA